MEAFAPANLRKIGKWKVIVFIQYSVHGLTLAGMSTRWFLSKFRSCNDFMSNKDSGIVSNILSNSSSSTRLDSLSRIRFICEM